MSRSVRPDYETLRERQARALELAVDNVPAEHVREVIAIHEGYGVEAWCPYCREHWPCKAAAAMDPINDPEGRALVQAIHDRKAQA